MTDNLLDMDSGKDITIDPSKDYFDELVGEGKKYKDRAAFSRSRLEADLHIARIEKENADMRADYLKMREESAARAKLEELIDQLSKKQQQQSSNDYTPVKDNVERPTRTPEELDSLLDAKLNAREIARKEQENFQLVKGKLKERFGDNYSGVLKDQLDSLGLTSEELTAMAKRQPKVVLKTLGLDQPPQQDLFQSPPRSNQRSDSFAPKGQPKRTWSYYQNLKKSDPRLYSDPKTHVQMHNDAIALGKDFEDGDFNVYPDRSKF